MSRSGPFCPAPSRRLPRQALQNASGLLPATAGVLVLLTFSVVLFVAAERALNRRLRLDY